MVNNDIYIDIIIPCYNCEEYIEAAINSVFNQTYTKYKIIVVDDASTDGTKNILNTFDGRIEVITHKVNKGVSAARNTGILNSDSELIAFLDADDVWLHNKLEMQIKQFLSNSKLGLSFSSLIDCDSDLKPIASSRRMKIRNSEDAFDELYSRPFGIPLSTVMIRRQAIDRCGGFNESLKGVEDYELWLRISMLFPISCIAEPLSFRRLHSKGISANYIQGEKLELEFGAIDLCGKFALITGRSLPMTTENRKIFSVRRRMNLAMQWNDMASVKYYINKLLELNNLKLKDKISFLLFKFIHTVRNIISNMKSFVTTLTK